jgi:hypothetical protein
MDDTGEVDLLKNYPTLEEALVFLYNTVGVAYDKANADAMRHQTTHGRYSAIAILGGGAAVVLAILQFALMQSNISPGGAFGLEIIAALAGTIAVVIGLRAKRDKHWFIQRHIAERLRMLKFQSLGMPSLWCGDIERWKESVHAKLDALLKPAGSDDSVFAAVREWARGGKAEPVEPKPGECINSEDEIRAIASYYRIKRVEFQAAYFQDRSERFDKKTSKLRHAGLPLFFASIAMVILHVIAYFKHEHHGNAEGPLDGWTIMGVWTLALAAILPVFSFGIRAWIGAFEHTRSASLFGAKSRQLASISADVARDAASLELTMRHIAHVEHFLEHEHREWLRLMLEAEWFL